jgi:hypothetical protein
LINLGLEFNTGLSHTVKSGPIRDSLYQTLFFAILLESYFAYGGLFSYNSAMVSKGFFRAIRLQMSLSFAERLHRHELE